tara:strand:+ start:14881 stop:16056 length:1176 start_codon:yes stop_codon:yes gene_type:complete
LILTATKTATLKRLTGRDVKTLKTQAAEAVGGHGDGALLFKRRDSTVIEAYYQYFIGSKRQFIKLGTYGQLTLAESRAKASDLAAIRRDKPDLKAWFVEVEAANQAKLKVHAAAAAEEAMRGSLQDLLEDYTAELYANGVVSAKEIERIITKDFIEKHPAVVALKAREVEPSHCMTLLSPFWERGAKTQFNRARTYLHAAFQMGLQAEYDVARQSRKSFGLTHNPVAALRRQKEGENAHDRALTDEELRHFWHNLGKTKKVGRLVTLLLQFMIATGGQRPYRMMLAPWSSYDMERHVFTTPSMKGRGKTRLNLTPLTDRAISILEEVRTLTGQHPWPWSFNGKNPLVITTPRNAIVRFCDDPASIIDENEGTRVQLFTTPHHQTGDATCRC